jgi:hypothetical protein
MVSFEKHTAPNDCDDGFKAEEALSETFLSSENVFWLLYD